MKEFNYFTPLAFLWELIVFGVLFQLSWFAVQGRIGKWMSSLGGLTYCIYLIHMQFVQILCAKMPKTTLFWILNPVIAMVAITAAVYCFDFLCSRFPLGGKVKRLVGL